MTKKPDDDGWGPLFWIPFVLIVLLVVAMFGIYSTNRQEKADTITPVPTGVCTCKDKKDLENRLNVVNAAIGEYQAAISDVTTHDAKVGSPTMFNKGTYNEEKENLKNIMSAVLPKGANTGRGDTGSDCMPTVDADTPCLRGSIQAHENLHQQTCRRLKQQNAAAGKSVSAAYPDSMTMVEYFNDEIAGYQQEIAYINANLKNLNSCNKYKCGYKNTMFDTADSCRKACPCGIGPDIPTCTVLPCIEINSETNEPTGRRF